MLGVFSGTRRNTLRSADRRNPKGTDMSHKYSPGQTVYFEPQFGNNAARGVYKIVRSLPIERDGRLSYRIKSASESFERIAEEHQLTRTS
jgi:hypothetical protein